MMGFGVGLVRNALRAVAAGACMAMIAAGAAHGQAPEVTRAPEGRPAILLGAYDIASLGYGVEEFFVSGAATSYQAAAGSHDAAPLETAPYATRIVVTRPTDPARFNGTVVVEWMNVSGGQDVPTDWIIAHRELTRSGYVHVGVSAQRVGVEGGPNLGGGQGMPLKVANPARYGQLSHPGDAFSYDIFSQAGALLRGPEAGLLLGGLAPQRILAVGESQSATFLVTYVNAVDPLARVFDGYLIHSRFGASAPLDGASMISGGLEGRAAAPLRPDLRAPVLTVITETDLLDGRLMGYRHARQPDTDRSRVWEVAGTAHADNYLFGLGLRDSGSLTIEQLAQGFAPTRSAAGGQLAKPINTGLPHHYVMQAAFAALDRWVRTGRAPPRGQPLRLAEGDAPNLALDENGLAEGGVRTPWVDAPTVRLSGFGNSGTPLAFLAGSAELFDQATLDRLYPRGKRQYLRRFERALNASIRAGFILPADKEEILGIAAAAYHGAH